MVEGDDAEAVANYSSEKAADGPPTGALEKADGLTSLTSDDACWVKWRRFESPEGQPQRDWTGAVVRYGEYICSRM